MSDKSTTFYYVAKSDIKDRIDVEIGDSKESEFFPQVKIMRWDNEVNFSVRLEDNSEQMLDTKDGIKWSTAKREANFYELPEGYELEVVLKEKPETNIVRFTMQQKGLEFFYQPELTADEKKRGFIRPDNVIGSYAAYYKDRPKVFTASKDYKCGKAFHIYRPRIEDAEGKSVWGDLNIDNGYLTVSIPQDFLDKAVYPIKHAAGLTIGYTSIGGSAGAFDPDDIIGGSGDGTAGTVNTMKVYGAATVNGNMKGVLVKAADKTIVANGVSDASAITTTPGWFTMNYSTKPSVSAQSYYPSFIANQQFNIAYDSVGSGSYFFNDYSNSYASPANPTDGAAVDNYALSIYAEYNTVFYKTLTASATIGASVVKGAKKILSATVNAGANVTKKTGKTLTGNVSVAAGVSKSVSKILVGTVSVLATCRKSTAKILEASVSVAVTVSKSITKTLTASVTAAAAVIKKTSKTLVGNVAVTAVVSAVKTAGAYLRWIIKY